jgi:Protein of unknown function (DUF2892)
MAPNMSTLDRAPRLTATVAAIVAGAAIGPGSAAAIVLFAVAAVLLATSTISFCPLFALFRFASRGHRPLTH